MGTKLAAVLTSLIMFAAAQVQALGLGEIIVESALNQPLRARIEVLQADGLRAEDINIGIASASDFERFSIDRPFFLESIFFRLETVENRTFVVLSTVESVREPYLNFVLETRWPSGRLLSEYTLLLDLPVFSNVPVAQTAQAPVRSLASTLQTQSLQNQSITQSSSGSASGQSERLVAAGDQNASTPQPQADNQAQLVADQTVIVDSSDTLWDIALQIRPDRDVSVQQTMLAIQRLNENAFIGSNINMIRSGQVLRVPDAQQFRALTQQQAVSEVSRQNLLFADRRNTPLSAQPLTPLPVASNVSDSNNGSGELSVVSATEEDADVSGQAARIASLENRMAVNNEELDRVLLQNSELNERLSLLEQQIASANEIIRLREMELAQLQQALTAQAQSPDEAVELTPPLEPSAVITMAQEKSGIATVVDALVRNTYALIGGLLLIILLLAMLLRRHRSESDEFLSVQDDEDEFTASPGQSTEKPLYANRTAAADPVFTEVDFDDVSPEVSPIIEDAQVDADPLDEVDTLLAYDRISAARVLCQNAIAAEPERNDLRLKLLEVCVAGADSAGFQIEEARLTTLADSAELTRIEELRSQLPKDSHNASLSGDNNFHEFNELQKYQELKPEGELVSEGLTADPVDAGDIGAESAIDDPEEDFNFDLSDIDALLADEKQALEDSDEFLLDDQKAVAAGEDEIESIDFNFSLDDLEDLSSQTAGTADTGLEDPELEIEKLDFSDQAQTDDRDEDYEFDVDLSVATSGTGVDAETVEDAGGALNISEKAAFGDLDSLEFTGDDDTDDFDRNDLRFLSDSDEAATKLDLARAYIDMGDTEGAREILQEVLQEGTAVQIKDARSLLDRIQ
jgi:pilus assembly protein FimV